MTFFPLKKKRGGSTFVFVDFFALKRFLNFFSPLKKKSSFVCSCYLPEFALNFFFVPFFFFFGCSCCHQEEVCFSTERERRKDAREKKTKSKNKNLNSSLFWFFLFFFFFECTKLKAGNNFFYQYFHFPSSLMKPSVLGVVCMRVRFREHSCC